MSGRIKQKENSDSPGPGAYLTVNEFGKSRSNTIGKRFNEKQYQDVPGPGSYTIEKPKSAPGIWIFY